MNAQQSLSIKNQIGEGMKCSKWDPYPRSRFLPNEFLRGDNLRQALANAVDIDSSKFEDSIKVLSVLGYMGILDKETWKTLCKDAGLKDNNLPVKTDILEKKWESSGSRTADIQQFEMYQWYVCVPRFGATQSAQTARGHHESSSTSTESVTRKLDSSCILPIIEKDGESREGSFGSVDRIKIHHSHFVHSDGKTAVSRP